MVKVYVTERGTAWIQSLFDPGFVNQFFIVRITLVEVVATIARQRRSGSLASSEVRRVMFELRRDANRIYQIPDVTPDLIEDAIDVAERLGLRGYDSVQLAAARSVERLRMSAGLPVLTLVSADLELNAAARSEGFQVEDPNNYP